MTGVWSEIEYFIIRLFYSYIKFTNFILVRIFNFSFSFSLSVSLKKGLCEGGMADQKFLECHRVVVDNQPPS